jgi:5-methylcytosine-specific restriction endonuclease McrBC regulatory subunit McrC
VAPSTSTTLALKTHSRFCGVVTGSLGDWSLTLVVSPKLWSKPWCEHKPSKDAGAYGEPVDVVWRADEPRKIVFLHEVETCSLRLEGREGMAEREAAFAEVIADAERHAATPRGGGKPGDDFRLVRETHAPRGRTRKYAPQQNNLSALYDLMLLRQRTPGAPIDDIGSLERDPMLIPLVHHLFVQAVHENRRFIRQGYVRREERLATVRGRVVASSLARHLDGGPPELVCRYEDFTHETPLFRVIATALDVVAGGTWLDEHGDETPRARGIRLRRYLSSIPSLPSRGMALNQARRLRLGPLLRRWERPLRLARMVLEATVPRLPSEATTITPSIWTLDTATLWEKLLEESLRRLFEAGHLDDPPHGQLEIESPFEGGDGTRHPDLVCGQWVLDAKYKAFGSEVPGDNGKIQWRHPETSDVNQMFVYAHVSESKASHVALLYPWWTAETSALSAHDTGTPARGPRAQGFVQRLKDLLKDLGGQPELELSLKKLTKDMTDWVSPLRFHRWALPFPREKDVKDNVAWAAYQRRLDAALGERLAVDPPRSQTTRAEPPRAGALSKTG